MNQGPTSSFRMWKEQVGSYMSVGSSLDDFKNFYRDLKRYIYDADGQMFVEMFPRKKENYPSFFFDFDVDESKSLCLALWADGTCRRNYVVFSDTISIDATYSTNKYNLVFVPFTSVDNHKRCVTFAIGLSSKEDVASYTWLFQTFLNAMGGNNRILYIITDRDPAVKIALPTVFPNSVHKFCVAHNEKVEG